MRTVKTFYPIEGKFLDHLQLQGGNLFSPIKAARIGASAVSIVMAGSNKDSSDDASPAPSWVDDWDAEEFMREANARFPPTPKPATASSSLSITDNMAVPKIEVPHNAPIRKEEGTRVDDQKKEVFDPKPRDSDNWRRKEVVVQKREFNDAPIIRGSESKPTTAIQHIAKGIQHAEELSEVFVIGSTGNLEHCYTTAHKDSTSHRVDLKDIKEFTVKLGSKKEHRIVLNKPPSEVKSIKYIDRKLEGTGTRPPHSEGSTYQKIDVEGYEIWTCNSTPTTNHNSSSHALGNLHSDANSTVTYKRHVDKDGFEIWLPSRI